MAGKFLKFQEPGPPFGEEVRHVPEVIVNLYDEARKSMTIHGYTTAVMACRKILMNVAKDKNLKKDRPTFAECIDYLKDKHHVSADNMESLKYIKDRGNEANHEIKPKSKEEAELTISFTEMLLKNAYELQGKLKALSLPAPEEEPEEET